MLEKAAHSLSGQSHPWERDPDRYMASGRQDNTNSSNGLSGNSTFSDDPGFEPAINPLGQVDHHERQVVNPRWLIGTIMTGLGGGSLLAAVLLLSLDALTIKPEAPELSRLASRQNVGQAQPSSARKSDRLIKPTEATGAKQTYKAPMTLRVAEREVIKVRSFVRVAASMSTIAGPLAGDVPPFNPLKLMTQSAQADRFESSPETGNADVALTRADLDNHHFAPEEGLRLSQEEIAAQVAEERQNLLAAGRRPALPVPPQLMLSKTLRPAPGATDSLLGYAPLPASASFSKIEVNVVPENVTMLGKHEPLASDIVQEEKITILRRGETIEQVLRAHGSTPEEVRDIVQALAGRMRGYTVAEGRTIKLLVASQGRGRAAKQKILRVVILDEEKLESIAAADDRGLYVSVAPPVASKPAPRKTEEDEEDDGAGLRLYDSFYEAALRQKIPVAVIDELILIFSNDVDFQRSASADDTFEVFYAEDEGGDIDLMFASISVQGERTRYFRYTNPEDGLADYYDDNGKSARKFLIRKPLAGGEFRSGFGMRHHPILRYSKMHTGVDYAAKPGTPIVAAGNGTVIKASWDSGYGRRVEIQHANNYVTTYSHLQGFARGIEDGVRVRQGQVIGFLGSSGLSTGPHLHYEVLVNNQFKDPMNIRVPRGRELDGRALAEFKKHREQVESLIGKAPGLTQVAQQDRNR